MIRIDLLKHSAEITWPARPDLGIEAGRLRVYTEEPLSDSGKARAEAEVNLYALARMLESGGAVVEVQRSEKRQQLGV